MGNQNSKEVKAESDGEEGSPASSPPASRNSSPRPSPDIVFSSQVHSSTPMNRHFLPRSAIRSDQYTTTHRHRVSTFNSHIPDTSPPKPGIKNEIPESPEYKKQISTPGDRSDFKPEKKSSNSPKLPLPTHTGSNLNATQDIMDDMDDLPSLGEPPSSNAKERRKRMRKSKKLKLQQLASPDLGNNQEPNSSLYSDSGILADPTPSKSRSSKRRKAETPSSVSRKKKKQKHNHDEDNPTSDAIPFSSLAESLYADRRKSGNMGTDENDFQDDNVQGQPSDESDQEPSLSRQSISPSHMSNVEPDFDSASHPDAVSGDEIKADFDDDPTSHNGSQPNNFENISGDDEASSEVAQSDDQDRMVMDEDGPSIDESGANGEGEDLNEDENEDEDDGVANDDEQNEIVPIDANPSSKSSSPGANVTSGDEYHLDEDLPEKLQTDDPRPKQNSARKRIVKPTFYERLAEESSNGTPTRGSSSSVAGPSTSTRRKQPKISTMLKGNGEDSPVPKTPKTPSQRRSAPSKTPKSGPHELATGPFSEFELRNITQAVERWRDDHNLTQSQVNSLVQGNPKEVRSQEFWARIVAVCPNRPRQKLINQCRRKFHNFVARGTWSEEQQEELKRVWEEHGNKYALIGKIINRHPEDVRDRIRNYAVCGDNRRSDPWTLDEEEKLQAIITDALRVIRDHRRKGLIKVQEADEELIDWQRVSELMDRTRSRLQCIQKWKIINRHGTERGSIDGSEIMSVEEIIQKARDEANAMSSRERFSIVKAILASDAKADSRIPWAKVRSAHLEDRWMRPTIMLVWYRLRHSVPDWSIMSTPEIVTQLSKTYNETRKLEYPNGGGDYDVDTEYSDMERKVQKMLKVHRAPKTPNIVVKTDDEDSEDEEGGEEDEESEEKVDDIQSDEDDGEASQKNGGTDMNNRYQEDSELEEASDNDEPNEEDTSMKDRADEVLSGSVDLGNDVEDESVGREPSVDAPSITKFTSQRVRRSQKRYSSSARSAKSRSQSQKKLKSTRKVIEESSQEDQDANNDEELSSDTNASEVESIPARL
ncbi:hypothetical protein F4805DRAFT_419881 [Annulohypoxylon moriforme]|nr:hypothetical protein F4805DRAFT_419881 [Annulohypoxylon moriforme]